MKSAEELAEKLKKHRSRALDGMRCYYVNYMEILPSPIQSNVTKLCKEISRYRLLKEKKYCLLRKSPFWREYFRCVYKYWEEFYDSQFSHRDNRPYRKIFDPIGKAEMSWDVKHLLMNKVIVGKIQNRGWFSEEELIWEINFQIRRAKGAMLKKVWKNILINYNQHGSNR